MISPDVFDFDGLVFEITFAIENSLETKPSNQLGAKLRRLSQPPSLFSPLPQPFPLAAEVMAPPMLSKLVFTFLPSVATETMIVMMTTARIVTYSDAGA